MVCWRKGEQAPVAGAERMWGGGRGAGRREREEEGPSRSCRALWASRGTWDFYPGRGQPWRLRAEGGRGLRQSLVGGFWKELQGAQEGAGRASDDDGAGPGGGRGGGEGGCQVGCEGKADIICHQIRCGRGWGSGKKQLLRYHRNGKDRRRSAQKQTAAQAKSPQAALGPTAGPVNASEPLDQGAPVQPPKAKGELVRPSPDQALGACI